jgi:hypothetical protein
MILSYYTFETTNGRDLMTKLLERTYFALAVFGLLLIWYFNIRFFASGGTLAPGSFVPSAFANPLTTSITLDVYWAASTDLKTAATNNHSERPPANRKV